MSDNRIAFRPNLMIEQDQHTEEVVLIDGHTGTMCACNVTAAALLGRLREGTTDQELIETLLAQFEVSESAAVHDVKRFLSSLSKMGFIEFQTVEPDCMAVA